LINYKSINDNVVIEEREENNPLKVNFCNIGIGRVLDSTDDRFKVNENVVYCKALVQPVLKGISVIKSYRVLGRYEGN
jgi:hypothetical protein